MTIHQHHEKYEDIWQIFRVISEFVDGFDMMGKLGPGISVFGSARTKPTDPMYTQAVECGRLLAKAGFCVITGGGPGIMEAANKGAFEAGGQTAGLNITLPMEQMPNKYQTHQITFRYFFVRKVMFVKYAHAFICFPGGYGTMDEFFEAMTLIQTVKIMPFPVICIGKDFWGGLIEWMEKVMLKQYGAINADDLLRFHLTDDVEDAVELVSKCYHETCWLGPPPEMVPAFAAQETAEGTLEGVDPSRQQAGAQRITDEQRQQLKNYPPPQQ